MDRVKGADIIEKHGICVKILIHLVKHRRVLSKVLWEESSHQRQELQKD